MNAGTAMEVEESSSDGDMVAVDIKAATSKKGGALHCILQHNIMGFTLHLYRCQTVFVNTQKKVYAFVYINRLSNTNCACSRL